MSQYWFKSGTLVVNGSGNPVLCDNCPCCPCAPGQWAITIAIANYCGCATITPAIGPYRNINQTGTANGSYCATPAALSVTLPSAGSFLMGFGESDCTMVADFTTAIAIAFVSNGDGTYNLSAQSLDNSYLFYASPVMPPVSGGPAVTYTNRLTQCRTDANDHAIPPDGAAFGGTITIQLC